MKGAHATRVTVAGVLAGASVLVAGCGGVGGQEASPPPQQPPPSPLASFDPCKTVSPDALRAGGYRPERQRPHNELGDVGCQIMGSSFVLGLYKTNDSLDYWQSQRHNFAALEPNKVGERNGLKGIVKGAEKIGICREIIDAPGGSVFVQVSARAGGGPTGDPCAEAMKIAQQVEPKLPK